MERTNSINIEISEAEMERLLNETVGEEALEFAVDKLPYFRFRTAKAQWEIIDVMRIDFNKRCASMRLEHLNYNQERSESFYSILDTYQKNLKREAQRILLLSKHLGVLEASNQKLMSQNTALNIQVIQMGADLALLRNSPKVQKVANFKRKIPEPAVNQLEEFDELLHDLEMSYDAMIEAKRLKT